VASSWEHGSEHSGSIKSGEFFDWLIDYYFLENMHTITQLSLLSMQQTLFHLSMRIATLHGTFRAYNYHWTLKIFNSYGLEFDKF
jgi:hypothetical protein